MENSIGKQILKFRKEKNASQAELASFLGVHSQTVSKWEREICLPDIAKLPQIAAFFEISLDELFGINEKNAQESAIFQIDKIISQKKWKEAAKKSAAFAIEFPLQKLFVQKLLMTLSQALLCKERFSQKFISQAVTLGKRAVQENSEPNLKSDVIHNLCKLLYLTGRNEEADFYREMLPSAAICSETLDMYKYKDEELRDFSSKNISLYYMLIGNSFSNMANTAESLGASETAAEYVKKAIYHYEEAYKYNNDERYIRNSLLSKIYLAEIYFDIGEKDLADSAADEAEIFAKKHGLYELYLKYAGRTFKNSK